jgi:hypothetical protein
MHNTNHGTPTSSRLSRRLSIQFLIIFILVAMGIGPAQDLSARAQENAGSAVSTLAAANPADPRVDEQIEQAWKPDYLKLATGDPKLLDHGIYAWPFDLNSIGWSMQSYQNYGGTPYFHHGMDMMKMWGTNVYNRSGGQVINIENYNPGWNLYWEVAVLDPYGYIWQYHHIDEPTIPDFIYQKYAEYLADPINGGFIPPDTYIGNIVEWPVWSYYDYFNHIHLNILAAGGVYVNGFEFHNPLDDTVGPEIQAVGLLKNGQIYGGNTIEGDYSLYVHARDLILDQYYYLPPWEITFSVDGGPVQTTWRFDTLPGGASDTAYLDDFYVVPPTCGDYECAVIITSTWALSPIHSLSSRSRVGSIRFWSPCVITPATRSACRTVTPSSDRLQESRCGRMILRPIKVGPQTPMVRTRPPRGSGNGECRRARIPMVPSSWAPRRAGLKTW